MTKQLKPGDKVMIYQKPLTREDPEGKATLVEQYREDEGDGLSMWWVRFSGDEREFMRTIFVEELK